MLIICIYEYGPGVVGVASDGPSTKVERKLWRFEIVTQHFADKIAVTHRATIWQTRPTARHKWQGAQGWHWNRGDVVNPRLMPANYFIDTRPEPPEQVVEAVLAVARGRVIYVGPRDGR